MAIYIKYNDPAHGWLAVPRSEVSDLGLRLMHTRNTQFKKIRQEAEKLKKRINKDRAA